MAVEAWLGFPMTSKVTGPGTTFTVHAYMLLDSFDSVTLLSESTNAETEQEHPVAGDVHAAVNGPDVPLAGTGGTWNEAKGVVGARESKKERVEATLAFPPLFLTSIDS
jgi:hypothetical protein